MQAFATGRTSFDDELLVFSYFILLFLRKQSKSKVRCAVWCCGVVGFPVDFTLRTVFDGIQRLYLIPFFFSA